MGTVINTVLYIVQLSEFAAFGPLARHWKCWCASLEQIEYLIHFHQFNWNFCNTNIMVSKFFNNQSACLDGGRVFGYFKITFYGHCEPIHTYDTPCTQKLFILQSSNEPFYTVPQKRLNSQNTWAWKSPN